MARKKIRKKKQLGTVGTVKSQTVRGGVVPKALSPVGGGLGTVSRRSSPELGTVHLDLPWPPSVLNPNTVAHWRKKRAAVKASRDGTVEMVKAQTGGKVLGHNGQLRLTLRWFPPDHRNYDLDNLLARTKSALDGMCRALGLDGGKWGQGDDVFSSILLRSVGKPVRRGKVVALIEVDPDALAFDELAG